MLYYEKYLENLRLNSIIFDDEIMDDIEYPETKEYVFSLEFLKKLNFRVSMSLLAEDLDYHVIDNIREVLNYIRFNGVNKEYIHIINQILITLNQMNSRGASTFYKVQRLKRNGILTPVNLEQKDLHLYTDAKNKGFLKTLRDDISLDHDILDTMLYSSDEDFGNLISDYTIEGFLGTINLVSYECTSIFENETFKRRLKYLLKHLSLLEGKRNIENMYQAFKVFRRVKKVI